MNLAPCGRSQHAALRLVAQRLFRVRLGHDSQSLSRPHQGNLHRTGSPGGSRVLVVLEFVALNAVCAAAVRAVELDLHVVQQRVALLHLHHLRRMNLVERVAPLRLGIGDAVRLLLYVDAQPLGQVAAVEGVSPLADGQKYRQGHHQQHSRRQHQCPHPLNGESHGSVPHAEAGRQPLRQAFPQFAPQQACSCP